MSVIHLFIAILFLLFLSILISVIDWILQSRLSTRITLLEKELEKKTLSFDALKKERASLHAQARQTAAVDLSTHLDMPTEPQLIEDGEIRVMRNVRGTFAPVEEPAAPTPQIPDEQIEATHVESLRSYPMTQPFDSSPIATDAYPEDTKRWQQGIRQSPGSSRPPATRSSRNHAPQSRNISEAPVIIPIFSPESGAADFDALYNHLIAALKTSSNPTIAFDCGRIQYFSDPELDYIEKIYRSLVSQNRSLVLLNCSGELVTCLQQHSEISSLVR
jgi:hypothetical protein